jgi:ketosteroid isomerase-like protein
MTDNERRNIETAKRYIELYNNDIERFVPECYTPDCTIYAMGAGVVEGPEQFLQVERAVLDAAPKRCMRLEHMHASGDVVTNEVTLLDPDAGDDWAIPFVAVLTMRDGKIAIDRTYADYTNWPGLAAFANMG